jgi:signal transduction histidine kinase
MKKIAILLALVLIMPSTVLMASDNDENVQNLVNSAITFFQDKGPDYSLKAFNALHGPFVKGPLYVFVGTLDGRMLAHPFSKSLLETPLLDVKDSNGKLLFQEMIAVAKNQGEGWVDYSWPYPGTKEPAQKRSYIKRIPSQDFWVAAGYYVK